MGATIAEMSNEVDMPADPVRRLMGVVTAALPALARPGEEPPTLLPITPSMTLEEAGGFFRAVDAGLFRLLDDGFCQPIGTRPSRGYWYPLLERPKKDVNAVRLWREWLTHAAVVARLHLDHGYPLYDIALEPDDALDVLVYSPSNQPLIAVEVKKTEKELSAMLTVLMSMSGERFEIRRDLSNAERKMRAILALRPSYFFAAAPRIERVFAVTYPADRSLQQADLVEIDGLPPAGATAHSVAALRPHD